MKKIAVLFSCLFFTILGFGQAGSLDPSFGTGGYTTTTFAPGATGNVGTGSGRQVLVQSDGKLIAIIGAFYQVFITRYNTDGSLDGSFGVNGFSRPLSDLNVKTAALQGDGKIVLAGSMNSDYNEFAMVRYLPDGSLDAGFGNGGIVTTNFGAAAEISAVAIQPDGKIVAAGTVNTAISGIALARYHPDGTLDLSYGITGIAIIEASRYKDALIRDIAFQADGKLVAVGSTNSSGRGFLLLRFNQDGTLDSSFKPTIPVTSHGSGEGSAYAVAIQEDGKIVVAGTTLRDRVTFYEYVEDFAIFRFNANGSSDLSFGGAGFVITTFKIGADIPRTVFIQNDGKIVVVGRYQNGIRPGGTGGFFLVTETGTALVRYRQDGSLEASFGSGGKVMAEFGSAYSAALQPDGKIVVAGSFKFGHTLERFNTNGSVDGNFNNDGRVPGAFNAGEHSGFTAVAVQPDGKVVAAGYDGESGRSSKRLGLVRYHLDGSLDASFGTGGKVTPVFKDEFYFNSEIFIRTEVDVIIQADGKIVVFAGSFIARFNPDGSIDVGFGRKGTIIPNFALKTGVMQPDGKLVAVGTKTGFGSYNETDFYIVRYTAAGSLDLSFGANGSALAGFRGVSDTGRAITIQPDGKIIVAGSSKDVSLPNATTDIAIVRLNPDGSLDASFDGDGKVITTFGADVSIRSVVVQGDGKIVAGGYRYTAGGSDNDFVLVRYNSDGSLDAGFDGDGKVTTDFGAGDRLTSLNLQPDGKIIASGYARIAGQSDFVLARYNTDGSLDASFGSNGKVIKDMASRSDILNDAAIANNRLYVVGTTVNPIQLATIAAFQLETFSDIVITTSPFAADNASICAGSQLQVFFKSNGVFKEDNVFTAYLYPAVEGGAATKTAIGSIRATSHGSPVPATIPANTPTGAYTIQVMSSSPVAQGSGVSLLVNVSPAATVATFGGLYTSPGLTYKYYEGSWTRLPNFGSGGLTPTITGITDGVNLSPKRRNEHFAFLWEGLITVPKAGTYYFETSSDDGSKLYIGSYGHYATPVVDNDGLHPERLAGGSYTFPAAGTYPIAITFFEATGAEVMKVYWTSAEAGISSRTLIPDAAFSHYKYNPSSAGLSYKYYEGDFKDRLPDFGGLTPISTGTIGGVDISPKRRDDKFAFLWEGKIFIPKGGTYYFETRSDDGSKLYIGNYGHYVTPVVDNDGEHPMQFRGGAYTFPSAGMYPIAVTFFEAGGSEGIELYWTAHEAGIPTRTLIPNSAFREVMEGPGCSPEGVRLTASEGEGYLWSTGETTRAIVVKQNGSYTVTVTTGNCSATSEPAVVTCLSNTITQRGGDKKEGVITMQGQLRITALPNPSASHFTLRLNSTAKERITIRLLDVAGRVVETLTTVAGTQVQVGQNLRPGTYLADVTQGSERVTVKLVKTGAY